MELPFDETYTIIFRQNIALISMLPERGQTFFLPAGKRYRSCRIQDTYYDPYTKQINYAIRLWMEGKFWVVHIAKDKVYWIRESIV